MSAFTLFFHLRVYQLPLHQLVKLEELSVLMLLYVSSQLDLTVEISLDLINNKTGNTLLVEDFSPSSLELGDLLRLIRDMPLILPPILVHIGLG
jgi:hypothetical protein